MLYRQCRMAESGIYNDDDDHYVPPKSTVLPCSKHAREQVFTLVLGVDPFTPSGRKMTSKTFWDKITPSMVEGRAQSSLGKKGQMTKAEEMLQGMLDYAKRQRDADVKCDTGLPEDESDAENNEEDSVASGASAQEADEADRTDEEKLAKLLAKAKMAKLFRGGRSVIAGLASVGAKKIIEEKTLQRRKEKERQKRERSAMHRAARTRSAAGDDEVLSELADLVEGGRDREPAQPSAWRLRSDEIRNYLAERES